MQNVHIFLLTLWLYMRTYASQLAYMPMYQHISRIVKKSVADEFFLRTDTARGDVRKYEECCRAMSCGCEKE